MKNEYKVTRELMMSWAKEYHLRGGKNILMFILWCMVGLCGLVSGILFIINGGDPLDIIISAFMFFFTVYKLAFSRFVAWSDRYKLLANTYDAKEWLRTTEFLEDEIIIAEHTTTMKCFYSEIDTVKEKGNAVLIFFKNNTAIRLYKDAFTDGSWDECKKKSFPKCLNKTQTPTDKTCWGFYDTLFSRTFKTEQVIQRGWKNRSSPRSISTA